LEYYFDVAPSPNWKYFANYADSIIAAIQQQKVDEKERQVRRARAKEWLNE
jgi:hypothetical protein